MYRVKLLYDVPGWAYHARCLALQRYAPSDFQVVLDCGNTGRFSDDPQDLYLQLCYSQALHLRRHVAAKNAAAVIVTGCNTGWACEGPREGQYHWEEMHAASDWIVFNSRSAWGRAGRPPKTSWISNGVDRTVFYDQKSQRRPRVLWIGSLYHTQPGRDLKGYWSILEPLQQRLESRGIPCDFRRVDSNATITGSGAIRYTQAELADWYNTGQVYVVASASEGTPNPALEAASCGCTIVSTLVGNMPELIEHGVNGLLVDRNVDAVEAGVLEALGRYDQWGPAMHDCIRHWDWSARADKWFRLFHRLIEDSRTSR